jgi:hypothetical protein
MLARSSAGRITPLVPFTVRVVRRIHVAVKLNAHRTVTSGAARRWPRLNAGSRLQVEMPMTGIRHFRAGAAAVKRAEQSDGIRGLLKSSFFRRAGTATRFFDLSVVPINRRVLAAA